MANKSKFTDEQLKAITETEGNMLVSASAGSGKTTVMLERIIGLVLESKAKISEILAVTFTDAAASEMKQKLVRKLRERLVSGEDNSLIREALEEVPTASVSTIHKFCSDLLRRYFYEIGIEPSFKIADKIVAAEIKNAAEDKVFSRLYEEGDEDFLYLVRIYRSGRNDSELKKIIQRVAELASYEKEPEKFLEFCQKEPTEAEYKNLEKDVEEIFKRRAYELIEPFEKIRLKVVSKDGANPDKINPYFDGVNFKLNAIVNAPTFPLLISACAESVMKSPSIPGDAEYKPAFEKLKEKLKKIKDKAELMLIGGEDADKTRFLTTGRTTKAIAKLTAAFMEEYADMKAEESLVDFSDLEHLAYKLLVSSKEALDDVRKRYKYAFCDEYQDVNGIQEAILTLVAPNNLFMVGDVKQSIYAFRGCNPKIFADKFARYEKGEGQAVTIADNFRSTDNVLSAVNNVFSAAMTESSAGINYAVHPMIFGKKYPANSGFVALHLIEGDAKETEAPHGVYNLVKDAETPDENDDFYEGLLVGEIIEKELGQKIYDVEKRDWRAVEPKDIAVLLRNTGGFTANVIKTLTRLNVPVSSAAKDSVLDYPEIKLLKDILSLIDFYADDSPLISVLKSSVGCLGEEELAAIREEAPPARKAANGKHKVPPTFLECVENYRKNGKQEKIRAKLNKFDDYFKKIRLLAEFKGAGEILVKVIKDCSLDLEVLTGRLGELRLERMNRFIAESVKDGEKLTVSEFLKNIENADDEISLSEAGGSNSVSVITMHSSKGLEYPVVILAGLGRSFNRADEKERLLYSAKYGIAPQAYDESTMTKRETLKRFLVKNEKERDLAREEMRLLYVAMTRAKNRLHLVASEELPLERTAETASYAKKFVDYLSACDMPVIVHEKTEIKTLAKAEETLETKPSGTVKESLKKRILEGISFEYPFAADTLLPVKRAVTKLSEEMAKNKPKIHRAYEEDGEESAEVYNDLFDDFGGFDNPDGFDKPDNSADFGSVGGADFPHEKKTSFEAKRISDKDKANEVGTAYHRFLEKRDLNEKNVDNELIAQLSRGDLTEEQAKMLDENVLKRVVENPVFEELKSYDIYREQPFVVGLSAQDAGFENATSPILVQGILDLLAIKGDEAIILDYKATRKSREKMLETYRPQLEIYKKAVEKTLKLKVKKTILFNLYTCETMEVK